MRLNAFTGAADGRTGTELTGGTTTDGVAIHEPIPGRKPAAGRTAAGATNAAGSWEVTFTVSGGVTAARGTSTAPKLPPAKAGAGADVAGPELKPGLVFDVGAGGVKTGTDGEIFSGAGTLAAERGPRARCETAGAPMSAADSEAVTTGDGVGAGAGSGSTTGAADSMSGRSTGAAGRESALTSAPLRDPRDPPVLTGAGEDAESDPDSAPDDDPESPAPPRSAAAKGEPTIAPTPNATARAPTRPTYRPYPGVVVLGRTVSFGGSEGER